jgi:hypothetical protein
MLTTGAALTLPAGLLAGCSAGQLAETSLEVSAVGGSSGQSVVAEPNQVISIRNATIDYRAGGYQTGQTAPLTLWVVNDTNVPVTLSDVQVLAKNGSPAGQVEPCAAGAPVASATPSAAGSAVPSGAVPSGSASAPAGSASATPSDSTSATPGGPAESPAASPSAVPTTVDITIQPTKTAVLSTGSSDGCLEIANLTSPVSTGMVIKSIFTFHGPNGQVYPTIGSTDASNPFALPVAVPDSPEPRTSISLPAVPEGS